MTIQPFKHFYLSYSPHMGEFIDDINAQHAIGPHRSPSRYNSRNVGRYRWSIVIEEDWVNSRSALRVLLNEHLDWSLRMLAERLGRSL